MTGRGQLLLLGVLLAGGCVESPRKLVRSILGPSPKQIAVNLESEDPDLRRQAIEALSGKDWGRREPYLKLYAAFTQDMDPTVRSAAVRAIGRAVGIAYIQAVIDRLNDREVRVRRDAAAALDVMVAPIAVGPLSRCATDDTSAQVRTAAARALRRYPQADVLEVLLACLDDDDFSVRFQACESLCELTGEHAGPDIREWQKALAEKKDLFAHPPKPKRAWWDWFGVRGE